ncbi:MAG: apolipoprotein N-acyltransferase [Magnetococcales bacterium]|nr:apolipoprotein N-acyltransferase [Magnetococcales bacterium]
MAERVASWRDREALGALLAGMVAVLGLPPDPLPLPMIVGLAVLIRLVETAAPRRGAWLGFCFGLGHFSLGQAWLWNSLHTFGGLPAPAAIGLMLGLAAILALYPALFGAVLPRLAGRPWLLPLAAPALWVVTEWLRAHLLSGFPWNLAGYAWDGSLTMLQVADLGGVYLLSWLILFCAALVAVLARPAEWRQRVSWFVVIGLAAGTLGGGWFYGQWRLAGLREGIERDIWAAPVRMAIVQGNIPQKMKWDPAHQEEGLRRYLDLLADLANPVDLVVWPETAAAFFLQAAPRELRRIADASRGLGAPILTGAPMADRESEGSKEWLYFNSMVMVDAEEKGEFRNRYDKDHLVPFGEYIPFRALLPGNLQKLTHGTKDFSRGGEPEPMAWGHGAIGALICYEVIFPDEVRLLAVRGARWLINVTNDAWFGESAKPQHLAMARMRAVENRLPMIRVANTGISAMFDHLGRELGRIDPNQKGVLERTVTRGTGQSVWVRTGRYWIWLWLGLCLVGLALTRKSA